jgi:diaminopimelate epimerase
VIRPEDAVENLGESRVQCICHRNYGVGSDGIFLGPLSSDTCDFRLRILNPDGSEAEKSGNGLRIFARYLYDEDLVHEDPFTVETLGDLTIVP